MTKSILLLHGALGSAAQMKPLVDILEDHCTVYSVDFSGHGGKPIPSEGFDMDKMADDLADYIRNQLPCPIPVFGYSMGGYIAAIVASRWPELIASVTTLGTKWDWSPEIASREVGMLNTEAIESKVPALAALIQSRHHPNTWKAVVEATARMLSKLGEAPLLDEKILARITVPVTILRGTADRMVAEEPSILAASWIPNAQYIPLQDVPHPFEQVDLTQLKPYLLRVEDQTQD